MGYFSADRVRWVPFFGMPLAFSAMDEDTSSVTAVVFECFLAVFISLGAAMGTLKRSMAFKIARNNSRGTPSCPCPEPAPSSESIDGAVHSTFPASSSRQ
jgi:hypothetical protein